MFMPGAGFMDGLSVQRKIYQISEFSADLQAHGKAAGGIPRGSLHRSKV
jgi:hypothetical protein